MTRFARAKGSKASNERREEEATPWHVMRQQLAEQLSSYEAHNKTNKSYNLKEILSSESNTQKKEVWSDFGEAKSNLENLPKQKKKVDKNDKFKMKRKKINHGKTLKDLSMEEDIEAIVDLKQNLDEARTNAKEKESLRGSKLLTNTKLKQKKSTKSDVNPRVPKLNLEKNITSNHNSLKRKPEDGLEMTKIKSNNKKQIVKNIDSDEVGFGKLDIKNNRKKIFSGRNVFVETTLELKNCGVECQSMTENSTTVKSNGSSVKFDKTTTLKKKIKKRMGITSSESESSLNELVESNKHSKNTLNDHQSSENVIYNSVKSHDINRAKSSSNNNKPYSNSGNYDLNGKCYKKKHFSRFPHEKGYQKIIANGREIRVITYEGFLVKKDDADDLKRLRKKLLAQKIPKDKLEHVMKLERRKAEKALVREKKKVCFNCRQFGHNFSDCPDIKDSNMVKTGVCFKCGSLEHSHFDCKVLQHQEYRHAVCFVCKEQGHIARQCPLNSQGLYPRGGSCHLCGEVTHLRKDCPKAVEQKISNSVTVDILKDDTVEDIGVKSLHHETQAGIKKKVIKFK